MKDIHGPSPQGGGLFYYRKRFMISSVANKKVKQIVQLQKSAKARREEDVFVVEGIRMFREAPKEWIRETYATEEMLTKLEQEGVDISQIEPVTQEVFERISDTKTPQGILTVLSRPKYEPNEILSKEAGCEKKTPALLLFLEDLQDPGNLGTIFRTSEGAGVTGIVMSKDCVDVFNPKTIRSTMGSVYRMPFIYVEDFVGAINSAKKNGVKTFAAHLSESTDYDKCIFTGPTGFFIGNEGNGLKKETADLADAYLKIPMEGQLESLNAAVATAVLIYEANRQRRNG